MFLQDLLIRLLRGCYPRRGVNQENWGSFLYKIIGKRFVRERGIPHPIAEGSTFAQLALRTKVEIVYSLCLYRLDNEDVEQAMKSLDADCLRVQSLGSDDSGNVYWYFYGTRLYKEELSEKAKKLKEWTKEWEKEQYQTPEPVKRKRGRPRKQKPVKSDGESEESEECDPRKKTEDSKSRWSVVCTTLTDWQLLADSFENSKSQCEKALYKIITKDFLPVLKDMYEQKAKRIKKKMMEFAPRRASSRLEVKKLQKSEEERLESIVAADEFEMYCQKRDHINNHPEDRKERLSRDRSRRLEERRQRIAGGSESRELQNKDRDPCEFNQHLPHDAFMLLDTTHNRSDEFRNFIVKMRQVIVSVKLHKDAWPFLQPVDDSYAPGYYDIICNPIDLSTIETKLNKGLYENIHQVDQDFNLMVDNCVLFNGEKSVYSTMAVSLRRHFRKSASKYDLLNEYHADIASKIPCLQKEEEIISTKSASPQKVPEKQKGLVSSENRVRRRKKKRPPGMKAIEALAEASAEALKKATVEPVEPLISRSQVVYPPKSQAFPDLKIVTIQSHPASLLAKYAFSVSQDSTGSDSFPYCSSLSPESSKDNEVDSMVQHHDHQESVQYKSTDESSVDVHSIYQSGLLNETDPRDVNDSLNTSHDSVVSHISNSSADEDSCVFSQVTNNTGVSAELDKAATGDVQQDLSAEPQNKQLVTPEGNQSDSLAKISSLFSRTPQRSPDCHAGSSQAVGVSEAKNASSPSFSPRCRESFNNQASETTPPPMSVSPCSQRTADLTVSPSGFGLLTTVDASILGLQCSKNLFVRNNPSKNTHRLDNLLSSLSPTAAHGTTSTQSPEKALHDALVGVEFVSDIAKTIHELDKLKTINSPHSPVFTSSGSPPLISSGSNFLVPNLSSVSPDLKATEAKHSGSPPSAVTHGNQSAFDSLQLTKTFSPAVYPVSPDSTDAGDKAVSSAINASADPSGNSSPSNSVESSNNSPQQSLASTTAEPGLTAQFFPLTLPLPQTDITSQSSQIPLQLPQSFAHPFMSDGTGKNLNSALFPSTVPFLMNTATNPLQLTIPIANSSSPSSSPITLVSSPQMFTTVPLPMSMTTAASTGTTSTPPVPNAHVDSSSSPKQMPKSQSNNSPNSQDSLDHNDSTRKSGNVQDSGSSSVSPISEMQSSSAVLGYHHPGDLQKHPSLVQNQSVLRLSAEQHSSFSNSLSTHTSFNIPRPPHCVPSAYTVQTSKTHTQDWNLQNFADSSPGGSRGGSDSARHSVIMAAHQQMKNVHSSVSSPVFTSAVSTNSDNVRLCGPSVVTTAGKDSNILTNTLAQTVPTFVAAAQPPQQNVIVNYMPSDLNNYSVNSNHVPMNNMQYNILPNMPGVAYSNVKDNRSDKNLTVSNGSSAQYITVSATKNNSVSTFGPNNVPASATSNFPNSVSTKTSQGSNLASKIVSKQSNKKVPVHNNSAMQKHELAAHTYLLPGAQDKLSQVLTNVPGLQPGVPTYFSMPHLLFPSQHGIVPSQLLTPHSSQLYQSNQRFVIGQTEASKANENRQSVFPSRNVQFLTAPSVSTTK